MKHLLLTGYDESYAPLAELTVPLMESFAIDLGIDFRVVREPLIDVPNGIYWTGIVGTLKAFDEGYGSVMYLDVDEMVTNSKAYPNWLPPRFNASRDWGNDAIDNSHFSMCGFVADKEAKFIFDETLKLEPAFRDKPFPAQGPLQHVYRTNQDARYWMNVHRPRMFNAVPSEVSPGDVLDPWQPGDFCAHLTMLPLPERVALFHKIKEQAGI